MDRRLTSFTNEQLAELYEFHMGLSLIRYSPPVETEYKLSEVIVETHARGLTLQDLETYLIY